MKKFLALFALFGVISGSVIADDLADFEDDYKKQEIVVYDPFYTYNKNMHMVNKALFNMSIRPVSGVYNTMVPRYVRSGVSNFFANLSAPLRAITLLISGRGKDAARTFGGFIMNSIAGVGGVFKIAPHGPESDFGLAAARWGIAPGAHIELPLLGPSNLRDALAKPFDIIANPTTWLDADTALAASVLNTVSDTAKNTALIDQGLNSVNSYVLTRDFYEKSRKDKE